MATHNLFALFTKKLLVASDNMYMTNQRMKVYFVNFFFHPKSLSFTTSVNATCSTQLLRF
jgi:hypothetical protein